MKPLLKPFWVHNFVVLTYKVKHTMANDLVDELIEGCNTANECLTKYWRTIWIIIGMAILAYAIMLAWTCWLSSKFTRNC